MQSVILAGGFGTPSALTSFLRAHGPVGVPRWSIAQLLARAGMTEQLAFLLSARDDQLLRRRVVLGFGALHRGPRRPEDRRISRLARGSHDILIISSDVITTSASPPRRLSRGEKKLAATSHACPTLQWASSSPIRKAASRAFSKALLGRVFSDCVNTGILSEPRSSTSFPPGPSTFRRTSFRAIERRGPYGYGQGLLARHRNVEEYRRAIASSLQRVDRIL